MLAQMLNSLLKVVVSIISTRSPQLATRATLLATECLKHHEKYLEAASYFIRLTSEARMTIHTIRFNGNRQFLLCYLSLLSWELF